MTTFLSGTSHQKSKLLMTQILSDDRAVRSLLQSPGTQCLHSLGPGAHLSKPSDGPPSRAAQTDVPHSGFAVSARRKQKASPSGLADDGFGESPFEGEVCKLRITAVFSTATWQNSSQG